MSKFIFAIGVTFIILGVVFVVDAKSHEGLVWIPSCTGNGGRWGPPQYYDGSAPDGWYPVWTGLESENGEVFFPLCPNSGSQLHGTWRTTIFIEQDFGGEVRVENNVIVEKR